MVRSCKIIKRFKPHAVVGVGGYASGPLLKVATQKRTPTIIQEQNSYAGMTNKLLAKKVQRICVAYPNMEQFFPAEKLAYTGNPVRKDLVALIGKTEGALEHFGFSSHQPVLLVLGGSLGAKTLNDSLVQGLPKLVASGVQVIWQCGSFYHREMKQKLAAAENAKGIRLFEFLKEMDLAYAAADVVISRAGALSVSELSIAAKPVVFVPSPNVAEDHQTKNARALADCEAAVLVKDSQARETLIDETLALLKDADRQARLSEKIKKWAKPDAAREIVEEIVKLIA